MNTELQAALNEITEIDAVRTLVLIANEAIEVLAAENRLLNEEVEEYHNLTVASVENAHRLLQTERRYETLKRCLPEMLIISHTIGANYPELSATVEDFDISKLDASLDRVIAAGDNIPTAQQYFAAEEDHRVA